MSTLKAYAYRSGDIHFTTDKVPEGAIEIASSRAGKKLREIVGVNARHGWQNDVLLVPGIPENQGAAQSDAALWHMIRFTRVVKMRLKGERGWPDMTDQPRPENDNAF